jgi:NCAIR mutase (PurE)-related protein
MQNEKKDLRDRTKALALQIVRMFAVLPKTTEAQVLGKQLRCQSGDCSKSQLLTQYKPTRKENKMAKKKGKKKIKAQDLKPKKDAKGGIIGVLGATTSELPAVQHQITMRKAGGDH